MFTSQTNLEKPAEPELELLRLRMVRELEEFLNRAINLPLPRLKIKPTTIGKQSLVLN